MAKRKSAAAADAEPAAQPQEAPEASPPQDYTVLARRYRPQQFKDLIGQEAVVQALTNALQTNRVAHAYLFTGLRGVGKTSAARILAKALNCVNGPTVTPCDKCELCRSIAAGEDMDVLEIDGASNNKVDEARELRSNVQYRPSRSRFKIYIIDEVHMLSTQAFNALLKTLEEPPAHVKFIMATTETHKIPATILSRCQRFDFIGVRSERIIERLREIVAAENRQADEDALRIVARRSGGSMRDSQSLLDQLLAFSENKLTVEEVNRVLGTASAERVAGLATAILDRDPRLALDRLAQILEEGRQVGELLDQLIDYWRDLLIARTSNNSELLTLTGALCDALKQQAQRLEIDTILAGLDVLVGAKNRMRATQHTRILAEMTIVRLGRLDNLVALADLAQMMNSQGVPAEKATSAAQPTARMVAPPEEKKKQVAEPTATAPALDNQTQRSTSPSVKSTSDVDVIPLTEGNLQQIWQKVVANAGPMLGSELAKASNVAIFGPNTLALHFSQSYNAERGRYLDPSRLTRVEEILSAITGVKCGVRLEMAYRDEPAEVVEPAGPAAPPVNEQRRRTGEMAAHPLIARALETLGAQILGMDEDFAKDLEAGATTPNDP